MSKYKNQHFVPQCYLKNFADLTYESLGKDPCVWEFDKDGKRKKPRPIRKVLTQSYLYSFSTPDGSKDHFIETELLQKIEGRYSQIFNRKIRKFLPLSAVEHADLATFVASMYLRNTSFKSSIESFIEQIEEVTSSLELQHKGKLKQALEIRAYKKDAHKIAMLSSLEKLSNLIFNMNIAFLCAPKIGARFITSDRPCYLFATQKPRAPALSLGFASPDVEVRLPLSPEITLLLSWVNLKGYVHLKSDKVEDFNRITRFNANKKFIAHSNRIKRIWFSPYPLSFLFIARLIWFKLENAMKKVFRTQSL